ncbi:MAG: translation initiation factor IF-2, partial [Candidatus Aenigmarchaeota archaeon]|nr:translation initiation factor IF-2 [Candidatus Aenigmarchaeota archaeon]
KDSKTPFVVAMNKIDRIQGWSPNLCFLESYEKQDDDVKGEFEKKFYEVIGQFTSLGFTVERFDRITDFKTIIAAVPISAKTGEGIPDLLTTLIGLAQTYLKDQLVKTDQAAGTVLEVKEITGLGTVIDCIIYDGTVHRNDHIVIGGTVPMIAKIRSLLMPEPMRDIRTEKKFRSVDECHAACGVRISAPGMDAVQSGSEIRTAQTFEEAEKLMEQCESEKQVIEIHHDEEGLILKSNTIGGLEALISLFKVHSIREAEIGQITKKDVMNAEANKDIFHRIVIGFNTDTGGDAEKFAKDKGIKILTSDVIYRLIEGYEKWVEEEKQEIKKKEVDALIRPGKMRIVPGLVFRASNPAIVGCEVIAGIIRPGYSLFKVSGNEIKVVGEIKQIQSQGQNVDEVKINDKVAVSIIGPAVGRQIDEGDVLYTDMNSDNYKKLIKNEKFLTEHEKSVLEEILLLKRKVDQRFGL